MKRSLKASLVVTALSVVTGTVFAQAKDIPAGKTSPAYVTDARGNIVVDPFGLCIRTPSWTPQLAAADGWQGAGCQCDKDVLPKEVCSPPPRHRLLLRHRHRRPRRRLRRLLRRSRWLPMRCSTSTRPR